MRIKQWKKNGSEGLEVDLRVTMPDGTRLRERVKSPVSSKSGTVRWAQQREAAITRARRRRDPVEPASAGGTDVRGVQGPLPRGALPGQPAQALDHRPEEAILDFYLKPRLGDRRLDSIRPTRMAKLKAELKDLSPKTVNNVLVTLSHGAQVRSGVGRPHRPALHHQAPQDHRPVGRLLRAGGLRAARRGGDAARSPHRAARPPGRRRWPAVRRDHRPRRRPTATRSAASSTSAGRSGRATSRCRRAAGSARSS